MGIAKQLHEAVNEGSSKTILEASLSRVWQHHGAGGFVIMTAWRGDKTAKENKANLKELKGLVRGAGYGFVPVEGVGQEKVDGKIVQASEPSILIPAGGKDGTGNIKELAELAKKWGKKYAQFAVLVHDPKEGTRIVKPNGSVVAKAKKFAPNVASEFFTRLKGGGTVTLEWWGVKYGDPPEGGTMAGYAEQMEGRVNIAECSDRVDDWLDEMRGLVGA